jgi:hypothetical protein
MHCCIAAMLNAPFSLVDLKTKLTAEPSIPFDWFFARVSSPLHAGGTLQEALPH